MTPKIRNLVRQADKVAASGKRAAARELYQQILAEDDTVYEAWLGLGNALTNKGDQTAAYEKAIALDADRPEAPRALAILRGEIVEEEEEAVVSTPKPLVSTASSKPAPSVKEIKKEEQVVADSIYPVPVDISEFIQPDGTMVCYGDQKTPTTLRCNRCGRPICAKYFKRTSVGYRCLVCIREIEEEFFTVETKDYFIASAVAIPLSLITGGLALLLSSFLGFWFIYILLFLGGGAGGAFVARISSQAIGRRRGRYIPVVVATIVALGSMAPFLIFFNIVLGLVYTFVATSAAYYQLKS